MLKFEEVAPEARIQYLDLLLVGDEDPAMLSRYLSTGTLFAALDDQVPVGVAMVIPVDEQTVELKISRSRLRAAAKALRPAYCGTWAWCMPLSSIRRFWWAPAMLILIISASICDAGFGWIRFGNISLTNTASLSMLTD